MSGQSLADHVFLTWLAMYVAMAAFNTSVRAVDMTSKASLIRMAARAGDPRGLVFRALPHARHVAVIWVVPDKLLAVRVSPPSGNLMLSARLVKREFMGAPPPFCHCEINFFLSDGPEEVAARPREYSRWTDLARPWRG